MKKISILILLLLSFNLIEELAVSSFDSHKTFILLASDKGSGFDLQSSEGGKAQPQDVNSAHNDRNCGDPCHQGLCHFGHCGCYPNSEILASQSPNLFASGYIEFSPKIPKSPFLETVIPPPRTT